MLPRRRTHHVMYPSRKAVGESSLLEPSQPVVHVMTKQLCFKKGGKCSGLSSSEEGGLRYSTISGHIGLKGGTDLKIKK